MQVTFRRVYTILVDKLLDAEHCGLSAGRLGHSNDTKRKDG